MLNVVNEEHPTTALFCVKCGSSLGSLSQTAVSGPTFPGIFDVRCWLEGRKKRAGFFGPYRRAFAIAFTVMPAPKQAIVVDANLHLKVSGILNKSDLELDVPVRKEDFSVRRFDLMTVSYQSPTYIYRHSEPAIAVPTDGGCQLDLTLATDGGQIFHASQRTFFRDREPGIGPRTQRPWTAPSPGVGNGLNI